MLLLSKSLLNTPVLSLQTGGQLAVTTRLILNPNNLKIEGFYCTDRFSKQEIVLLAQEIRDMVPRGFVVDDNESLSSVEDLVRLKDIVALQFELMGKLVVTVSKNRLGKIDDYAADDATLFIQKLYVGQNLLKSFSGGQLSIDRSNVVEITNRKIVVEDILKPTKNGLPVQVSPMA